MFACDGYSAISLYWWLTPSMNDTCVLCSEGACALVLVLNVYMVGVCVGKSDPSEGMFIW
jgi:hypothetical protein